MSKIEQQRRYRRKYPEKVKEMKRRYYERKIIKKIQENPELVIKFEKKLYKQFVSLTRLQWKNKLPKNCENCGISEDLQIHHKQYKYPIERIDLLVLCKRCHTEEHQKIPTSPNDSERL